MMISMATRSSRQEMSCSSMGRWLTQLPHHLDRQVSSGLGRDRGLGPVTTPSVTSSPSPPAGVPARVRPRVRMRPSTCRRWRQCRMRASLLSPPRRFQIGQPVQEAFDIGPAKHGWVVAAVGSYRPQALRQGGQADHVSTHGAGTVLAPPVGQIASGPPFGGLPQPLLADVGEVQASAPPERGQVPHVLDSFGLRVEKRPADMPHERVDDLAGGLRVAARPLLDGADLPAAQADEKSTSVTRSR
jgi:hypothetical protein